MQLLIALAIIAILLVALWAWLSSSTPSIVGAVSGGGSPSRPVDAWVTAPTAVVVGVETEFVFESQNNNPVSTGLQLSPISGRRVDFSVQPADKLKIVSIGTAAVNSTTGSGSTGTDGRLTVKIKADGLPDPPTGEEVPVGVLVAVPAADTSLAKSAGFTVRAN